ncbi:hypothetical protein AaE_016165 [Aphanomyces astaci]|uniref:Uncharacterized protein n=1 Tax=Aphanomyces astaci TaxID=112090 RepID=A0A6A4YXL8_APHAT|nr:hypothetical protein AaE_016165 [Aphanomyces astaci]
MWDGKIGLWPIVETKEVSRRTKNRDRGTPVTVPMTGDSSDSSEVARTAWWDNLPEARQRATHVAVDDVEVLAAGRIQLTAQPAMSPDFNVLDLGFFNAIQSLQHQTAVRTIYELIASVQDTFLTWQVMEEAFKLEGDNVYKLSHLKKDVQLKSETVALRPPCDEDVTLALETLETRLDDEHLVDEIVGMLGSALNIVNEA